MMQIKDSGASAAGGMLPPPPLFAADEILFLDHGITKVIKTATKI